MKKFLFLLVLLPSLVNAQFKRSATELARDNIREYVTGKLFRSGSYHATSYGDLTVHKTNEPSIAWTLQHDFTITEIQTLADKRDSIHKSYRFLFYLDDKMNVIRAESYF